MIEIGRTTTIPDVEEMLVSLSATTLSISTEEVAKLAGSSSPRIFSDIWTAIAVGSFCRRYDKTKLIAWGVQTWPDDSLQPGVATSLSGLTAMQLAGSFVADSSASPRISDESIRRAICVERKGILDPDSGSARTLVEFDPEYPLAGAVSGKRGLSVALRDQRRMFAELILKFRSALEIGAAARGITPVSSGPAGALGEFLVELHDNGLEHGTRGNDRRALRGVRFLRLRKHIAPSKEALLERAGDFPELQNYLNSATNRDGAQAVIEASVSDFGLGIIDNFLSSPAGRSFEKVDRRTLLDRLLVEQLSSKSADPAAGRGIRRALEAAKGMQAFVSLRTAEFWLCRSYMALEAPLSLQDVKRSKPLGRAVGTHWQFLWPQPLR